MFKKTTIKLVVASLLVLLTAQTYAQKETVVSGVVRDAETGAVIPSATIIVKGKVLGTSTDLDGNFNFGITLPPPFTLVFSAVGYEIREYDVKEDNQELQVNLRTQTLIEPDFVVSGSRLSETVLQSPVAIEKTDLEVIEQTPERDFYGSIADIKGVHVNHSSLTYRSINTRGFSGIGNPRFVQIIDGIDNSPPGLNFAIGNFAGISELDVAEIELIPGASSALYGPNAYNGIMFINSKSPFDYTGLSASLQNGITVQDAAGTNPFINASIRYAQSYNDNFAFKFNVSAFKGTDWHATDYTDIDPDNTYNPIKGKGVNPAYDGVNSYGDEIVTIIDLDAAAGAPDGTFDDIRVARTGYNEVDLVDNVAESYKMDASLNYRLTETVELIGSYRGAIGKTMFQGANRYSFRDINLQQTKIEMKGENFFLRTYGMFENSANSYDTRFLSWNMNRYWKSDTQWFQEYTAAYLGSITGVPGFDHTQARAFADRDRLEPGTPEFEAAFDDVTASADLTTGAKFVDKTNLYHVEMMYDMSNDLGFIDAVIGGNFRKYFLRSDGSLFNDAAGTIGLSEYGMYLQASKSLLRGERLKVGGSLRYDKNQNFDGRFTPKGFVVYSLGVNREHNLRATYQQGFRNPEVQSQYINLDLGFIRLLGGVEDNLNNFSVPVPYIDAQGNAASATVNGGDIYTNSYTLNSVEDFAATGNPAALEKLEIDFIKPETIQTYEIGYRGVIQKRFYIDIDYYFSQYENFIGTINALHPLTGSVDSTGLTGVQDILGGRTTAFQLYSNADGTVTSQGIGVALNFALRRGYRIGGNYSYATFDIGDTNPDLVPGFNTPKNRFMLSLGNANVYKGFGFKVSHRWSDEYLWESTFGRGVIEDFHVTNAQISYDIPDRGVRLKIGGNNIFQNEYRTAFGAPNIGGTYYITLTFHEF